MKFRHKNYVRICTHTRDDTVRQGGKIKKDRFLLILQVMRLCNRSGNLSWTSEEHAYTKLRFKSVAIMRRLKNNLHHKFRAPFCPGDFFFALAPNICGSPVRNLLHVTVLAPRIVRCLPYFLKNWWAPRVRHN